MPKSLLSDEASDLIFLKCGSGDEETDEPTAHESFELSELKYASITPLGLPGICSCLRLWGLFL